LAPAKIRPNLQIRLISRSGSGQNWARFEILPDLLYKSGSGRISQKQILYSPIIYVFIEVELHLLKVLLDHGVNIVAKLFTLSKVNQTRTVYDRARYYSRGYA